jgi:D-alanyl-D-alanine carboxypeptidase (penicillin-binding protein 5/6)
MDVSSGRVLAQHNARQRMYPASTTKTMTALVAIAQGKLDRVVRVGPNPPQVGESSVHLLQGEQFTLADLVRAAMIKSANDSCVAIAEGVAGSVPAFAEMMNRKAQEVGARDTNFVNPHGLHDPNHYTTAYDLALITRAAMRYPFFNAVVSTREATIHGNWKIGPTRVMVNRNRLLFRWPECDGVKTGYTKQAGRCLIASATRMVRTPSGTVQPFRLLSVVLHAPDTWSDSRHILQKLGFERFSPVSVALAGEDFGAVEVSGGAFNTRAVTPRAVSLALRRDENAAITRRVHLLGAKAPLRARQTVGYVEFLAGTQRLAEAPLVTEAAVPASMVARVLPSAARVVPSNPVQRFGLYGVLLLGLAFLMALWKIRARKPRQRQSIFREVRGDSIYGQPQISQNIPPQTGPRSNAGRPTTRPSEPQQSGGTEPPGTQRPGTERPRAQRRDARLPDDQSPGTTHRPRPGDDSTSGPTRGASPPEPESRRTDTTRHNDGTRASSQTRPVNATRAEDAARTINDARRSRATRSAVTTRPTGGTRPGRDTRAAATPHHAESTGSAQGGNDPLGDRQSPGRQANHAASGARARPRSNARIQRLEQQARERRAQSEQTRAQVEAWETERRRREQASSFPPPSVEPRDGSGGSFRNGSAG